jgi:hypothetical protein
MRLPEQPALWDACAVTDSVRRELQTLMNVGPRIADDLILLGVAGIDDLATRDADSLYRELCTATHSRQDPCVLDAFRSAVDQARGLPARPWWEYSRSRKAGSAQRGCLRP